jgi:hypothetical protein
VPSRTNRRGRRRLLEDKDGYILYTVVILKKFVESFRADARAKKFVVRDFTYDEANAGSGLTKIEKLEMDCQETLVSVCARAAAAAAHGSKLCACTRLSSPDALATAVLAQVRRRLCHLDSYEGASHSVVHAWLLVSASCRRRRLCVPCRPSASSWSRCSATACR